MKPFFSYSAIYNQYNKCISYRIVFGSHQIKHRVPIHCGHVSITHSWIERHETSASIRVLKLITGKTTWVPFAPCACLISELLPAICTQTKINIKSLADESEIVLCRRAREGGGEKWEESLATVLLTPESRKKTPSGFDLRLTTYGLRWHALIELRAAFSLWLSGWTCGLTAWIGWINKQTTTSMSICRWPGHNFNCARVGYFRGLLARTLKPSCCSW